jgi:hypothetical protein
MSTATATAQNRNSEPMEEEIALEYYRFDLKIVTAASDDPGPEFQHKAGTFLNRIQRYDRHAVFRTWTGDSLDPISKAVRLPHTFDGITRYFDRYSSSLQERQNYVGVFLGLTKAPQEIMQELGAWLQSTRQTMYLRQLQCPKVICIGWFCYSNLQMNPEQLANDIYEQIGVRVGLRWQAIATGTGKAPADAIKALHIEMNADKQGEIRKFKAVYKTSAKAEDMPAGIQMRRVPLLKYCFSVHSQEKFTRL